MKVIEVCRATGSTRKALRVYEDIGLLHPERLPNGYREYREHDVRLIREIRKLNALGIPLHDLRPFVDCLNAGSEHADECPATLTEYRLAIERIDASLDTLHSRRDRLVANLASATERMLTANREADEANVDLFPLSTLPESADDGAAQHLPGTPVPAASLPTTENRFVPLHQLGPGRTLIYVFPMTDSAEGAPPDGWDSIPGAQGCTPHNYDMRNHYSELVQAGVRKVFGLSSQPMKYQTALAERLQLPYPLISDESLTLADDPGLPTFSAGGKRFYRRLAFIINDGSIEHVFYPVLRPESHASVVLNWLQGHPDLLAS